ncbi:MAG: nuclear transport factor 2 family protein [Pseudomonadota bacterium]
MLRKLVASISSAVLIAGSAMADQTGISQTLTDIAAGADRHDWVRVRDAFADNVTVDYTSLWGGEPVSQPADELVASWAGFLPGFDSTHHMVTNHTISLHSQTGAIAEADFTATHRLDDDLWVLGGRYSYVLEKTGDRWVVTSLKMTALWEKGDRGIVVQAGERAAAN